MKLLQAGGIVAAMVLATTLMGASSNANPNAPFQDGTHTVTPLEPAPGFNPFTASNTQLIQNGFPARPQGPTPAWWTEAVTHATHYVTPHFTIRPNTTTHPANSTPPTTSTVGPEYGSQSPNWAGNVDNQQGGYHSIVAKWVIPSVSAPYNTPTYSSIWPGIGSGNSPTSQLIQAGTEEDVTWEYVQHVGYEAFPNYYLWWEIFPSYQYQQTVNIGVSPGNQIFVNCSYASGEAHFYIENESTGNYTSFNVSMSGYDGSQAEWIVERSEHGGYYPELSHFSSAVTFTDANAEIGSTWSGVGNWAHYYDTMYDYRGDDSEQTDAFPGSINSAGNSFPVNWSHYGDQDNPA